MTTKNNTLIHYKDVGFTLYKSKLRLALLITFFSFALLNTKLAQNVRFDSVVTAGIHQIYNIEFEKADSTFTKLEKEFPNHPAGKFFKAMIIWWKITLDPDNENYDELFEDRLEEVIDFCDDLLDEDEQNVDAIFFKGGALGFRGRLYAYRKDWFDAALDGKDALPLVYEAYEIDSTNEDVKLGFGIYNYYAEAIPKKYPFIKPAMIFFPSGNKELGIKQLKTAAKKAKYAAIESKFFLMTLYYQFEEDYNKALVYAEELTEMFPNNPTFEKYHGRIYIKKGNYSKATPIFEDIKEKCNLGLYGYSKLLLREANYYIGVYYMNNGKIDEAENYFIDCFNLSKELDKSRDEESGFLINSLIYLAKIQDKRGNVKKAKSIYTNLLEMRDYSNSHKKAEKYLDSH